VCSFGGPCGAGEHQLDWPRHLAVDEDSRLIFVADELNDRVVVLRSPTLEFVRLVRGHGLSQPRRLYLAGRQRLYAGQWGGGGVAVIAFQA